MSEGTGSCRRGGDGRTTLRPATRAHTHLVNRQLLQLAAHNAWWPLRGWVAGVHLWAAGSKQASSSRHAGRGGRACTWQRWRRRPCACAACPAAPCSRHAPRPLHRHRHPGDGVEVALVQRHGVVGVDHLDLCGRGRCAAGQARRCGRRCGRAASFECPSSHAAGNRCCGPLQLRCTAGPLGGSRRGPSSWRRQRSRWRCSLRAEGEACGMHVASRAAGQGHRQACSGRRHSTLHAGPGGCQTHRRACGGRGRRLQRWGEYESEGRRQWCRQETGRHGRPVAGQPEPVT